MRAAIWTKVNIWRNFLIFYIYKTNNNTCQDRATKIFESFINQKTQQQIISSSVSCLNVKMMPRKIPLFDVNITLHCLQMQWSNKRAKSTDRDKLTANKLTAKRRFRYSHFVTDLVAVISSQSEGLGKMALGIVKIHLVSPFSANRRCPRSVCSRSVGSQSVCRGQLLRTLKQVFSVGRDILTLFYTGYLTMLYFTLGNKNARPTPKPKVIGTANFWNFKCRLVFTKI